MSKKKWSGRAFTSLLSLVSFILLGITGVILYLEPHGRVAYWTKWRFWGLQKDQLGSIHILAAFSFLVAAGFHLYYNWQPLIKYLSGKIETSLHHKRELIFSGLIFIWVVVSGIWALPPLVYVIDVGQTIKNSWVTSSELEPPFGHAESVSLKTFCKKQRIPLDQAMAELRNAGFKVDTPNQTLAEIADSKSSSGMDVYAVIKKLEAKPEALQPGVVWTAEKVEETFSGTGLGRKTIGQIIKDLKLDSNTVYQRLNAVHIKAENSDKFKDLADEHNTTPIKLLTVILMGKD